MKKITLITGLIMICNITFSQNLRFYGLLPAVNQTGQISKKINYNLFVSTTIDAFDETINGVEYPATDLQFYLQPSIIYIHSPNLNYAGSYTFQRNNPFNGNFVNEHRVWQQIIFTLPISNGRITNRIRFEERFIKNNATREFPFSTRARYQIGYNIPLQGRILDIHECYFNSYNEFYFSLTGSKNATYSENWTYAGIGYTLGKMGRIEAGYMFQFAVRNTKKDLRFLNLAQIMRITNFNL